MCGDGWESVGDIAARIVAAATGRKQPPPFGAAGEVGRRGRNVIPFPERGRAPGGVPGLSHRACPGKNRRDTGRMPRDGRGHRYPAPAGSLRN